MFFLGFMFPNQIHQIGLNRIEVFHLSVHLIHIIHDFRLQVVHRAIFIRKELVEVFSFQQFLFNIMFEVFKLLFREL